MPRPTIMKMVVFLFAVLSVVSCESFMYSGIKKPPENDIYPLPDLPYGYSDLEPHIDTLTLKVHHGGHHKAYTDKMNVALKEWRSEHPTDQLARSSIVEILQHLESVPSKFYTPIRHNGGGPSPPSERLKAKIERSFGSFGAFIERFTTESKKLFGSGYVWLCEDSVGRLLIETTANQDSPLTKGLYPVLVNDIWEHAYYLKNQNRRPEYISSWWRVVSWESVEKLGEFWHSSNSEQWK